MQQVSDAMDLVEPYCRSDHQSARRVVHLGEDRYLQLCRCLVLVMACDHVLSEKRNIKILLPIETRMFFAIQSKLRMH